MEKAFRMLLCLCFICSSIFFSCRNQFDDKKTGKEDKNIPELTLIELKISGNKVDVDKMVFETVENEIDIEDITAVFSYGDVEEEAIGVNLDGKDVFNVGSAEFVLVSVPEDKPRYQAWSKKMKVTKVKRELPVAVGWDYQSVETGTTETFDCETLCFYASTNEDVLESVTLNYDGKAVDMPIEKQRMGQLDYWLAERMVFLPTDDLKDYEITVKPKDSAEYKDVVVKYKLKGTKIPNNNATFMYIDDTPDIWAVVNWKDQCNSAVAVDYGASSIDVRCRTLSPRAKVKARFVNPKNNEVIGEEVELVNEDNMGVHKGHIDLLTDKPTSVLLYVIAEDGLTQDDQRGKWTLLYNPMDLYCGYDTDSIATAEVRKSKQKEYASVDIVKTQVQNGRIYLVFVAWAKEFGFVPKSNPSCVELDTFIEDNTNQTAYRLEVDVNDLQVGDKKDVIFTIMKTKGIGEVDLDTPVEAFDYRVTVNMK